MLAFLPAIATAISVPAVAWRADTGHRHADDTSAADVIAQEQKRGLLLDLLPEFVAMLAGLHASALLWVTFKRTHAARYGPPLRVLIDGPAFVIGQDDTGGFLILFLDKATTQPLERTPMTQSNDDPTGYDEPKRPDHPRATAAIQPAPDGTITTRSTYLDPNENPALQGYKEAAIEPDPTAPASPAPTSDDAMTLPRQPSPGDKSTGHYADLQQITRPEGFEADLAMIATSRDATGFAPAEREIVQPQPTPDNGAEIGGYVLFEHSLTGGQISETNAYLFADREGAIETARNFPFSQEEALRTGDTAFAEIHPVSKGFAENFDEMQKAGRLDDMASFYSIAIETDGATIPAFEQEPGAVSFERVIDPVTQQQETESTKRQEAELAASKGETIPGQEASAAPTSGLDWLAAKVATIRAEREDAAAEAPAKDAGPDHAASFGGRE